MNAHLPAVLHRKIAGVPVWGIGLGGGLAFGLYRRFHSPGIGGAQAATTPATGTGDGLTGDPTPADSGTFPYSMPSGSGSVPGGSSSGGDYGSALSSVGDAITGLGDLFANQPPPPDYSQEIGDLTLAVGGLRDQLSSDHGQSPDKPEPQPLGHKAAQLHAKASPPARGGHSTKPAASKPATHPAHPKTPATHPAAKPAHVAHTPPKPAVKHPKKGK